LYYSISMIFLRMTCSDIANRNSEGRVDPSP